MKLAHFACHLILCKCSSNLMTVKGRTKVSVTLDTGVFLLASCDSQTHRFLAAIVMKMMSAGPRLFLEKDCNSI